MLQKSDEMCKNVTKCLGFVCINGINEWGLMGVCVKHTKKENWLCLCVKKRGCKMYTTEQKKSLLIDFAGRAHELKKYPSLTKMAEAGTCDVWFTTLKEWADADEELGKLFTAALMRRADAYSETAQEELDRLEEKMFFKDSLGRKKECMTMVSKSRLVLENCRFHMAQLAPNLYGDYYHRLKEQDRKISEMQKQIDDTLKVGK